MSGKAGSAAGIVIGILIIAFNFYNPAAWVVGIAMIAGGAIGLASKTAGVPEAQAQDLEIAMAATGVPVPVVFGRARVTPNFLRSSESQFAVEEVKESGGKGGGDSYTTGFKYYHRWEFGYCMGPVDAIGQIWVTPGENALVEEGVTNPFSGDTLDITLETQGEEDEKGGVARFYRGSSTQTRSTSGDPYAGDGLAYQNVCWAVMGVGTGTGFLLGSSPYVPTLSAEIFRLPKCLRDDGSEVTGIKTRGSNDSANAAYLLANPAAIAYESTVNKVWGAGLSSDLIDEANFAALSEFYAANNIGVGLVLERTVKLDDWLEAVLQHCGTIRVWDGEKYKLRCVLDAATTHASVPTLTNDDIQDFEVSVPTWASGMPNVAVAEFVSVARSYKSDTLMVHDLANIDITGRSSQRRMQLDGFTSNALCAPHAARILFEMSQPRRAASWTMNRFQSQIQPGDIVRVVWAEFADTVTTSYWLVMRIKDAQDADIRVEALEDTLLPAVAGEETSFTLPDRQAWQSVTPTPQEDIDPDDLPVTVVTDHKAGAWEPPVLLTKGEGMAIPFWDRADKAAVGIYSEMNSRDPDEAPGAFTWKKWTQARMTSCRAELVDALPGGVYWDRSAAGCQVDVTLELNVDKFLEVDRVSLDSEHLETMLATGDNYIVCEDELMQVGLVELVSGNRVRLRNMIRGLKGSNRAYHAPGSVCWLLSTVDFGADGIQGGERNSQFSIGDELWFRVAGAVVRQRVTTLYPQNLSEKPIVQLDHEGTASDTIYIGLGERPLSPQPVSIADTGTDLVLELRARQLEFGAGIDTIAYADTAFLAASGTGVFTAQQFDASLNPLTPSPVAPTTAFTPATLRTPHVFTVTIPKLAGVALVRVWAYSADFGKSSVSYAEFCL